MHISVNLDLGQTLVVFSHPNHEIAIMSLIKRLKPRLLYWTDGGGKERIAQTTAGLKEIDIQTGIRWHDMLEETAYAALLSGETSPFEEVVSSIREVVAESKITEIFCDAVEFYNPVHDMTLPLVLAAVEGHDIRVFEVPIIHQKANSKDMVFQRPTPNREARELAFPVDHLDRWKKQVLWDDVYKILRSSFGSVPIPKNEKLTFSGAPVRNFEGDCVLRYEERAKQLLKEGKIQHAITYQRHYVPMVERLLGKRLGLPSGA